MIGYFTVIELTGDDDAAGFKVQAKVKSQMNENIIGLLWLPPHLRQGQSQIDADSTVWGILDEVSGIGCAMMGIGDADFGYFYDADIQVKKKLTVDGATALRDKLDVDGATALKDKLDVTKDITTSTGNISANVGDFEATLGDFKVKAPVPLSLSLHVHATAAPGTPSTPIAPPAP